MDLSLKISSGTFYPLLPFSSLCGPFILRSCLQKAALHGSRFRIVLLELRLLRTGPPSAVSLRIPLRCAFSSGVTHPPPVGAAAFHSPRKLLLCPYWVRNSDRGCSLNTPAFQRARRGRSLFRSVSATNGHFVAVVVADGFPNTNRSAFIYPLNKGRDPNWQHVLTDITELKALNVECDSFPNPQQYLIYVYKCTSEVNV